MKNKYLITLLLAVLFMITFAGTYVFTDNPGRTPLRNGWTLTNWFVTVTANDTINTNYFTLPINRDHVLSTAPLYTQLTIAADTVKTTVGIFLYGNYQTSGTGTLVDTLLAARDTVKVYNERLKVDLKNTEIYPYYYWQYRITTTTTAKKTTPITIKMY